MQKKRMNKIGIAAVITALLVSLTEAGSDRIKEKMLLMNIFSLMTVMYIPLILHAVNGRK